VIPFLRDLGVEEEDGVAMEDRCTPARMWKLDEQSFSLDRPLRIGVVAFPHMANFTDFDALAHEPSVSLAFLEDPRNVPLADVLIFPGSKQTIDDLEWLKGRDFTARIRQFSGVLAGICGGFQMLGLSIEDPMGVENGGVCRTIPGLGQLPIRTVLREEKTVRRATGKTRLFESKSFSGYEIHMGETLYENGAEPFAQILRENETTPIADGAIARSGRVFGTYVHGLFDDDAFRHGFLDSVREACGLAPARDYSNADREARINRWADHLRESLDMNLIRGWL
jgi:adenosylcobyric acid synthase